MNNELQPHDIPLEINISNGRQIDEVPTTKSLVSRIKHLPIDIQEKILNDVLTTKGRNTLHSFLKLYIYRYGLESGPLLDLPYHPTYPFLATIKLNPIHYRTFPEEAYFLLWYLASLYTIGVVFLDTRDILNYIKKCIGRRRKPQYNIMHKWLTLFHDIAWWEENIQSQKTKNVFVTFKIITYQVSQGDNAVRVERRYEAHVKEGYGDPFVDSTVAKLPRMKELLIANGVDEQSINQKLLHNYTEWQDPEIYPLSYILEIQEIVTRFLKQYEWSRNNSDHPVYRVLEERYIVRRYVPGFKYCVTVFSDSEESDPEDDDPHDEAEFPFRNNG